MILLPQPPKFMVTGMQHYLTHRWCLKLSLLLHPKKPKCSSLNCHLPILSGGGQPCNLSIGLFCHVMYKWNPNYVYIWSFVSGFSAECFQGYSMYWYFSLWSKIQVYTAVLCDGHWNCFWIILWIFLLNFFSWVELLVQGASTHFSLEEFRLPSELAVLCTLPLTMHFHFPIPCQYFCFLTWRRYAASFPELWKSMFRSFAYLNWIFLSLKIYLRLCVWVFCPHVCLSTTCVQNRQLPVEFRELNPGPLQE